METKKRDGWDKADVILKPVGGLLTALALAALGFFGSNYLESRQDTEMRIRLYTELISKREAAESALRKDMFGTIFESFLKPETAKFETKVLNLELLSYNFHESLSLKPLFVHLANQITKKDSTLKATEKSWYLNRLHKVAGEITRKQMATLEAAGEKFERSIDLDSLLKNPEAIQLDHESLKVGKIERAFKVKAIEADRDNKEVKVRLEISTSNEPAEEPVEAEFWVGFFDFPMIDNTRLSRDQRCAIVLNKFEGPTAEITVVYFPGSHASLKERPYYQEVIESLLPDRSKQK